MLPNLLARLLRALILAFPKVIRTKARIAELAIHHRIIEPLNMPRRFPRLGVLNDRRVEADDGQRLAVRHFRGPDGWALDQLFPPVVADVVFELGAQRAVVPEPVDPAIDLGRGIDEPAPFGQGDDLVHGFGHGVGDGGGRLCHGVV